VDSLWGASKSVSERGQDTVQESGAGAPSLWDRALERLKNNTPDYAFKNWFLQIREVGLQENRLVLGVPNFFVRDWLVEHYFDVLRKAVHQAAEQPIDIEFVLASGAGDDPSVPPRVLEDGSLHELEIPADRARVRLREQFTFESYVVGPSNQLAAAAALAVADRPGKIYNPLFIYGGTGLGKTHLLHAIGNRILEREPQARILYTSAEQFLNEFVVLLRKGRMEDFRKKFREEVDVLMMDDIQVLKKAQETQNEFFHTFNDLSDAGKAIVLTSDIHPNELPNIEARLRSRFASGLTADIYEPSFEVRVAILKRKAEIERLNLPDEVAQFVAHAIQRNVRELEGALTRLAAHASLTHRPLNVAYAEEILRDMIPPKQALSIEHVQKVVSRYFALEVSDLCGEKRTRPIAKARGVAMYFARKLVPDASFPVIGARFGNKHHTTVMSAVEKVAEDRSRDPSYGRELEEIERQITGR
jgi:chromosomal replication initiator protein